MKIDQASPMREGDAYCLICIQQAVVGYLQGVMLLFYYFVEWKFTFFGQNNDFNFMEYASSGNPNNSRSVSHLGAMKLKR